MTTTIFISALAAVIAAIAFFGLFAMNKRHQRGQREFDEEQQVRRGPTAEDHLRKFTVVGVVEKHSDAGVEVIGRSSVVKLARTAKELEDAWYRDMRAAFSIGPDYNVEYHCTVTPVD